MAITPHVIDLFEEQGCLPPEVAEICEHYTVRLEEGEEDGYKVCEAFLRALKGHGYFFEFGLDAVPYNLRPIESEG